MSKAEENIMEKARKFSLACATSLERNGKSLCWSDLDIAYIKGYRQAEEDLELGLDDIKTIDKLLNQCVDCSNPYQEVLKRFKELKGVSNDKR